MAANTKGKRKVKGKTLDLNTFLGEDADAPSGYAVVQPRRIDWADAMDNEDLDDRFTLDYKKDEKLVLPTAPKAARGPDVDLAKVPSNPPFTAFLGNLPYDVSEEDISFFFRQLEVKNVRLPRENGEKGRIRGFGYAEFNSRQDLIQALALNNESLKNRAIKISLAGEHDGDRGGDRRDAGPDRTLGDWRSSDRQVSARDDSRNDSSQSSRGGFSDREPYRAKSSYDRPFERNERNGDSFNRSDFGTRTQDSYGSRNQDRDYGGRSNDRDFGGGRSNDRDFGGGRSDRDFGGGRDQDRRGYGFSSDRGDRGMSRGGGGRSDSRDYGNFGRREDSGRDSRYSRDSSDRDPPRESYRPPAERPSYDSGSSGKERPRLQLAPRTKPIEPVPPPAEAVTASSIFGGAKPVDTAAREREIEERLNREKDVVPKDAKEKEPEARVRKFSSGSGMSNRSRRSSDSGPGSAKDDEEPIPQYKPPIPRQLERDTQPYTLPRTRQRCGSNGSTGSDRDVNSKASIPAISKKENYNNYSAPRSDNSDDTPQPNSDDSSYSESKGGFKTARNNHSLRDNSRERALHGTTYEEPKAPVYTCANKFSYLTTDAEDLDRGSE